ncbi:MAG: TIR domain-containing protein [Gammaproteobacteria bacterium]|nr:TIR domain-containing protein [Gammaproteobacteria bacterium]
MNRKDKLKLFISYSHEDEESMETFKKHLHPFETNDLLEPWCDRKILPGKNYQQQIDCNLEDADIICLLVSASFLASAACLEEKSAAFSLMESKGISVCPIILSDCGWLDDKDISPALALPKDGKSIIDEHNNSSSAWNNVYNEISKIVNEVAKLRNATISDQFSLFLNSTDMLAKAHSVKDEVTLDDVFVYPEFEKFNETKDYDKNIDSEEVIRGCNSNFRLVIAGENQSGKTTLCRKLFLHLFETNYFPVYISDRNSNFAGKIENRLTSAFQEQYRDIAIDDVSDSRIVPIVDDFHFAKNKENHMRDLSKFTNQVIIVDDIFGLNLSDENLVKSFDHYKIKEFRPSFRNKLIRNWTGLTNSSEGSKDHQNDVYQKIDSTTELVDTALGKALGTGLMPAYPFFILTVISTIETFGKTLDQEISSQGHCYQALIYLYLKKEGVKNEEMDTYVNFLTECSFYFYEEEKTKLSVSEFKDFLKIYLEEYNLPISQDVLLNTLQRTQMIALDDFGNYSFCYPYLYYFFVAKYLSEHLDSNKTHIDSIIENLHRDENAYIAIFVSHHSRNPYILDEITLAACGLFENNQEATLRKDELVFFDKQVENIVQEVLPSASESPEEERTKRLAAEDAREEGLSENGNGVATQDNKEEEGDDDLQLELRKSIKTVEVMGRIIKSRAGSLKKDRLEQIFKEGMDTHLRILKSYFDDIENNEDAHIEFLRGRVQKIIQRKSEARVKEGKKVYATSDEDIVKLSRVLYWNMNFQFIHVLIAKIVHSLGSNKLIDVTAAVCDEEDSPASFLVKHGILMWYNKNLQINEIVDELGNSEFSETAKRVLKVMIVNHCSIHKLGFKERQRIEKELNIPSNKLIKQIAKTP